MSEHRRPLVASVAAPLVVAVIGVFLAFASTRIAGQTPHPESIQGTLADGSNYRAVKPTPWNGTIVLDLDFANNLSAPPPREFPSSGR